MTLRLMVAQLLLGAVLAAAGCNDDSHKGTISHGPAVTQTASGAAAKPKLRLIYGPGSPLSTMRVATVFKARLAPLGIDKRNIKIGGEQVHVDVPQDKAEAVKKALSGGRLDLFVFDDNADPFASKTAEHAKRFELKTEKVGDRSMSYLVAKPKDKAKLQSYVDQQSTGARGMLGAVHGKAGTLSGYRSFFAQAGKSVRGEFLKAAKATEADGRVLLELTFEGSGKAFVLWNSKQRARFLVQLDELVIGTTLPKEPVKDGVLRVAVDAEGDTKATLAVAQTLAKQLHGVALSHLVKFEKQRPL